MCVFWALDNKNDGAASQKKFKRGKKIVNASAAQNSKVHIYLPNVHFNVRVLNLCFFDRFIKYLIRKNIFQKMWKYTHSTRNKSR